MRILVVSDIPGNMLGGVSTETAQLINGLGASGHQVAFLGDIARKGIGPVRHFPLSLPTDRSLSWKLKEAIDAFKPDLIHVLDMGGRGIMRIASQLKSMPWVFTCHSLSPFESKLPCLHSNETAHYAARSLRLAPNTMAWKWLFRNGFISHAIVHSHFVEDTVRQYGQPKNRTSLIPLGCDIAEIKSSRRLSDSTRQLRLVTVGAIIHTKGYHDAFKAIGDLRRTFPDLEYDIIGEVRDQSYLRFLEAMIRRLGLSNSVRMLLHATDREKDEALRRADVYLQPSHEEGFCLAYIEAAPIVPLIVGTDTGAIKLISANDIGARVVPARQPSRIADAVRELVSISLPPGFLLQRRARLAREFSWSKYFEAHELLYQRLINTDYRPPLN